MVQNSADYRKYNISKQTHSWVKHSEKKNTLVAMNYSPKQYYLKMDMCKMLNISLYKKMSATTHTY